MRTTLISISTLTLLLCLSAFAQDQLKPEDLEGTWSGEGTVMIPTIGTEVTLDAEAKFQPDADSGYIRTSMLASGLLFTYTDSGRIWIDEPTDSLTMRVWDGFGRTLTYYGHIEGMRVNAGFYPGAKAYEIDFDWIGSDSLTIELHGYRNDVRTRWARFELGRRPSGD